MKKLLLLISLIQLSLCSFGQTEKDKYIIHTNENTKHQTVIYTQDTLIMAMDMSSSHKVEKVMSDSTFMVDFSRDVMHKIVDDIPTEQLTAMHETGFTHLKQVYYVDDQFYTIGKWELEILLMMK